MGRRIFDDLHDMSTRLLVALIFVSIQAASLTYARDAREVGDPFQNTRAVSYVFWPCQADPELATQGGNISELDLLAVRRPRSVTEAWFRKSPSWPYELTLAAEETLRRRLSIVGPDLVQVNDRGQDNWGAFISLSLKDYPEIELRRYAAFLVLGTFRLQEPLTSKDDYRELTKTLINGLQFVLYGQEEIGHALTAIQEPFAFLNQPLIRVTHLDNDSFKYLMRRFDGASLDYWTADELVEMGVLPSSDLSHYVFDYEALLATHFLTHSSRLIVGTRPPILQPGTHWKLANASSIYLERLIRFQLATNVVVPSILAEIKDPCKKPRGLLARAREEPENIRVTEKSLRAQLDLMRSKSNTALELGAKLAEVVRVLSDVHALSQLQNGEDPAPRSDRFLEIHGEQPWRSGLNSEYVKRALRFRVAGPFNSETRLRDFIQELDKSSVQLNSCVQSTAADFERLVGALNFESSLRAAKVTVWVAVGVAIFSLVVTVMTRLYPERARRIISRIHRRIQSPINRWRRSRYLRRLASGSKDQ